MREVSKGVNETKIPIRNSEGYMDLTAHKALSNVQQVSQERQAMYEDADNRCNKFIKIVKIAADLSGFELVSRLEVQDRKTGRLYR